MKLKRLYIKEYGILKDFVLEFPEEAENNISVFIGENGSGKTTVLEAITKIFSWFINGDNPKFEFKLEYRIRFSEIIEDTTTTGESRIDYIEVKLYSSSNIVEVDCHIADKILKGIKAVRGSRELSEIKRTIKDNKYKLLPDSIAIYYAGESTNIKNIVDLHNEEYSEALWKLKEDIKPRIFFYYEPYHFNLLFLGLLSFEYGNIREILFDKLNFNSLHDFTITLKEPYWRKSELDPINGGFWGANGAILILLKQLFSLASRTEMTKQTLILHFDEKKNKLVDETGNNLLDEAGNNLVDEAGNKLGTLKDLYGTEREFFKILEMTWQNDLIESVNINIYNESSSNGITVNSKKLSEGEKQTLVILGLNELVLKENSLALYDEPDTYLHPKWQSDFIPELNDSIENAVNIENSYIITSHSPQLLSNASPDKTFVKIFDDGEIIEITPKHYGREISSILYNLMGVKERNKIVRDELSKLFSLIEDENIIEAEKELARLNDLLGENDPDLKNAEIQIQYLKEDEENN